MILVSLNFIEKVTLERLEMDICPLEPCSYTK